jgi:hypothetical protein
MSRRLGVGLTGALALVTIACACALSSASSASASSGPLVPSNDPFYTSSGSLGGIAPGAIIRRRSVTIAENGNTTPVTATQVLYRTTGELGQPTATVATILEPAVHPLTKIVSYQTAYDGLGSECDPSYTLQGGNSSYSTAEDEEQIILGYVAAGDTVVVPDYEGEQLDWAAGQESGYNTLDGIRAAENLLGLPEAGTPVGMVGYSGGSIATDFASELARKYAPKLDLIGVAEGGVPADFFHNLTYINGSPSWSGVIPAVFVSLGRAFGVSFTKYLSPYGLQITNQVKAECINNFVGAYPGLTYQKLLKPQYQDIYQNQDVVRINDELIMTHTGTPKGPMFIGVGDADGTGDGVMVTKDDEGLAHTYCERGVSVQFNIYSGDDHTNAAIPFEAGALNFLTDRFNGLPVQNGCSSIGAGNALNPLPIPPNPPSVKLADLGASKRRHGVVLQLSSAGGTLADVVVTVRRGGKLIERFKLARLTSAKHRLVLRARGRMPRSGRYTVQVSQDGLTLLSRTIRVR